VTSDRDGSGNGSTSTGSVYGSSISMFVFIKNSIKRCTALTTGPTFLSLSREFKTCLQNYSESLRSRCPSVTGQPPVCKLPPGSEASLCYIVNTCEYCAEVTPQLESMIQNKILKDLVDSVSFDSEVESFMDVLAHALNCLQFGLLDKLENGFRTMQGFNWGAVTVVGEESGYLYQWQKILQDIVPSIRDALSETYFRTFCTKFATHFLNKYLDIIVKQKKISEIGTQQLLLDTYNIKTLLLHFHHMGQQQVPSSSSSSGTGLSLSFLSLSSTLLLPPSLPLSPLSLSPDPSLF
jgi:vacuolar protein sorting-associated protein 53